MIIIYVPGVLNVSDFFMKYINIDKKDISM